MWRALLQSELGVQPLAAPARPGATRGGVHLGIAMGDIHVVLYRPFSQTHIGVVGDAVNLSARLLAEAASNEMVVANTFYQKPSRGRASRVQRDGPVEAKNVGLIKAWKFHGRSRFSTRGA